MPKSQQATIAEALEALHERWDTGYCGWTIFTDSEGEHWFEITKEILNFDWPFMLEPDSAFEQEYLAPLAPFERTAFHADLFATYSIGMIAPETLVSVIDRFFADLYDLPDDYRLLWEFKG